MKQKYLETGEIVSTHGVRGEVKIYPWSDSPDFLLQFKTIYIGGTAYSVAGSRVQGTCVLMKLAGVDTIEQAERLRSKVISFDREDAAPVKGYYISDLLGIHVYCDGTEIGVLKDVLQYPGNDVWVVRGKREYLIPSVPQFLLNIDPDAGRADVALLEGMASDEN